MMPKARDVMQPEPKTVSPDLPVPDLARRFVEDGVSGYPVVDARGELLGVVTETDLIFTQKRAHVPTAFAFLDAVITLGGGRRFQEELRKMAGRTVGEIMTRPAVSVPPELDIEQVATIMVENQLYTLPVVDGAGRVVGVVGRRDMVRAFLAGGHAAPRPAG